MSAEAVGWVYKHSPYTGVNFAVHLALADSANDLYDYEIWARQQWVADKARTSRSGVNRFVKEAIEDGFVALLEDNSRTGHANRYRLLMPGATPQVWSPKSDITPQAGAAPRYTPPDITTEVGVAPHDTGCSTMTHRVSHHATHNPREPKLEPNPFMSAAPPTTPSEPRVSNVIALDQLPSNREEDNSEDITGSSDVDIYDKSGHAREMCELLARKIEEEHGFLPKVTDTQWVRPMDLLLRRGALDWADPQAVEVERVRMMIEYVYSYGTEGDKFRWADQVKSPVALRKHWEKLRVWANREHQSRAKAKAEPQGETNQAWMVRSKSHG